MTETGPTAGTVPRRTPADAGEAARVLSADPHPVLTGAVPSEPPEFVRQSLAEEGRAVVSTELMAGVDAYSPEDLTVAVGAGTPMSRLQEILRGEGQWLPLSRAGLRRSAGGLVSAAPPTPYAVEYGPVRRQVLAVRVVTFDGDRHEWGRAAMKNVAGYDMPRLICGSRGRLGLVTRVVFRVWPLPPTRLLFELRPAAPESGDGSAAAGATASVDAGEDWRPAAESWTWSVAGEERPPLVVELAGSDASVEARAGRLRRWAGARGFDLRRRTTDPAAPPPVPAEAPSRDAEERPRPATLRFRVAPRYVADTVEALRGADAVRRVTARPRQGRVTALLPAETEDPGAIDAGAAAPDAAVHVGRGRRRLHRRADARRNPDRAALEERVLDALGGRPRAWAGDFV